MSVVCWLLRLCLVDFFVIGVFVAGQTTEYRENLPLPLLCKVTDADSVYGGAGRGGQRRLLTVRLLVLTSKDTTITVNVNVTLTSL